MTQAKDLRVAIYYDNRYGRNDGAPLYYKVVLERMGFPVTHLIPTGDTQAGFGKFDLHFWVDWGEDALRYPEWHIPEDGGKTIYVASDTHLDDGYRYRKAAEFDYAFFNQLRAVDEYSAIQPSREQTFAWLPHAFEPLAYPHYDIIPKYDVAFIGHLQAPEPNYNGLNRRDALDRLFREFPNFYYGSRHPAYPGKNLFEDAARHFCESKIVFNISIRDDVNMRVFETLGTGSFLLTNYLPTLDDLFTDGQELVMYRTYDEMVQKASYYLKHDKAREKIARAGYKAAHARHTYAHRIKKIFEVMKLEVKINE